MDFLLVNVFCGRVCVTRSLGNVLWEDALLPEVVLTPFIRRDDSSKLTESEGMMSQTGHLPP